MSICSNIELHSANTHLEQWGDECRSLSSGLDLLVEAIVELLVDPSLWGYGAKALPKQL